MFRQNEIVAQDPATDGCYRNSTVRLNCHLLLIVQRNYAKYARLRVMLKLSYTVVVSVELLIINPEVLRERQPQRRGPRAPSVGHTVSHIASYDLRHRHTPHTRPIYPCSIIFATSHGGYPITPAFSTYATVHPPPRVSPQPAGSWLAWGV